MNFVKNDVVICATGYLKNLAARKYSKKSIESYENALNRFETYLCKKEILQVSDVTYEDLLSYRLHLQEKGYAKSSVDLYLRSVRGLFNWLEETGRIFLNPASELKTPLYQRNSLPVPDKADIKNLFLQPDISTASGIRDRAILESVYSTGMLRFELCRLDIFDVDLKEGFLKIRGQKNRKRNITLSRQARSWLKKYTETVRAALIKNPDEHALWVSVNKGKRLGHSRIDQLMTCYARKAGLKISLQVLRRACVMHRLESGADPVEVQLLLGHANLNSLSQFTGLSVREMKNGLS